MLCHMVSEKELDEWLRRPQWQIFASGASQDGVKRLEVDRSNGCYVFRVTDRGDVVFLGADRTAAIAAYNRAR